MIIDAYLGKYQGNVHMVTRAKRLIHIRRKVRATLDENLEKDLH